MYAPEKEDSKYDQRKPNLKCEVQKLKYNNKCQAEQRMQIHMCAASHLGISGIKHVLLPFNSLSQKVKLIFWSFV